jgi:hypothetical protein
MSPTWHIVRKDFRRLRLPLALWLLMMLLHTALLWRAAGLDATPTSYEGMRFFAYAWQVIVMAVGFVLAAWLIMEDSLVSDRAFWRARPINGARILAAKLGGALLFFCVLPTLVFTPVWVLAGFSIREWGVAALELALQQAMVSAVAIFLAGITATPGQFLVRAVGLWVFLPLYLTYIMGGLGDARYGVEAGLAETRFWLTQGLLVATPAVVIVHQFLTRYTLRSCALGTLGLLLMLGVKLVWPWDLSLPVTTNGQENQAQQRATSGVEFVQRQAAIRDQGYGIQIQLQGVTVGIPSGSYLRMNHATGVWVGKDKRRPLPEFFRPPAGSERPPHEVVLQVSGLPVTSEPNHWEIEGREQSLETDWARTKGMKLEYDLDVTLMQGQLLGELPLQVGAELRVGSSYTRIAAIERREDKLVVRLVESDASSVLGTALSPDGYRPSRRTMQSAEDVFLTRSLSLGAGEPALTISGIGALRINSLMLAQRELILTAPTRERDGRSEEIPDWEQNTVIVKVRFLPQSRIIRRLTADLFAPSS